LVREEQILGLNLLALLLYLVGGGSRFLENVGYNVPNCTVSHLRSLSCSLKCMSKLC